MGGRGERESGRARREMGWGALGKRRGVWTWRGNLGTPYMDNRWGTGPLSSSFSFSRTHTLFLSICFSLALWLPPLHVPQCAQGTTERRYAAMYLSSVGWWKVDMAVDAANAVAGARNKEHGAWPMAASFGNERAMVGLPSDGRVCKAPVRRGKVTGGGVNASSWTISLHPPSPGPLVIGARKVMLRLRLRAHRK
ncbi:hypothetical protein LZ30DRAFT_12427 [Colletotrichum cereale]|nr:hypothetical protein LZ30DRAFT_12427 [Colletotrichum cereale]